MDIIKFLTKKISANKFRNYGTSVTESKRFYFNFIVCEFF